MSGTLSRRNLQDETAATLIEFAIIVPLLLLLLFGIVESSRLIAEFASIRTAAREGARFATTTDGTGGTPNYRDCSEIIDATRDKSVLGDTSDVSVTWSAPGYTHTCTSANPANDPIQSEVVSGTIVEVEVVSAFDSILPLVSPFFDGIELDTKQSREIFVGETTS